MDWYNKHRQRKFEDMFPTSSFISQLPDLIARELNGEDVLSHAMLFTSQMPGLGKTTTGRIFASELNPELTDEERDALFRGRDVHVFREINASDKGTKDYARTLDELMRSLENSFHTCRYVFLINECHMLTKDAQSVLLDFCTENIPENVYMILTTTEMSKIRGDLLSRLTPHEFRPLVKKDMQRLLTEIAIAEGQKNVEQRVIDHIFAETNGSPRLSINLLQQYVTTGELATLCLNEQNDVSWKLAYQIINLIIAHYTENISWMQRIAPLIIEYSENIQAEDARRNFVRIIRTNITPARSDDRNQVVTLKEGYANEILGRHLLFPLPTGHWNELIIKLYSAYMEIMRQKVADANHSVTEAEAS